MYTAGPKSERVAYTIQSVHIAKTGLIERTRGRESSRDPVYSFVIFFFEGWGGGGGVNLYYGGVC